jgi:CubicO group peptidase (beta-lactamase class C family)
MLPPSFVRTARHCLLVALLISPALVSAADRARLDTLFEQTLAEYPLPGLAVGVIEDGQIVYQRTAGERVAGSGEAIDADTLFKIASNSKAMTTGVLARLVDEGKLAWDDPVTKYLPRFRMYDPWVTRNIQVRDLLIHNSGLGLGAGDLMLWPEPNDFIRADIIAGLAFLKPTHSFRAHYAYDNLLYVVAGEVAAAAGGKPYEQLVREQLFGPLGMTRCQVGAWQRDAVGNVAQPHMRQGERNLPVREDGARIPDSSSMAAGGIRCSLRDMLSWMQRAWLVPDTASPWLSDTQRRAVWTLATPMPISQRMRDWDSTRLYGYGYGWRLSDVDGEWKVAHTGTLMGMYSSLVLLPDRRSGFVILINGDGEAARTALGEALQKSFTRPGSPELDVSHYARLLQAERDASKPASARKPDTSDRRVATPAETKPWLGVYRDPWFGEVRLCPASGAVRFVAARSPLLRGKLMRSHERWLVDWDDDSVDAEPWLTFVNEGAAAGARMTLAAIDPDADFSYDYADLHFTRVADCR